MRYLDDDENSNVRSISLFKVSILSVDFINKYPLNKNVIKNKDVYMKCFNLMSFKCNNVKEQTEIKEANNTALVCVCK